jgi:hypothetical protein
MLARRAEHLEFAIEHRDRISYGGLLAGPAGPSGICYFVQAVDAEEVHDWTDHDPYRSLYASVEVQPFVQRVPEGEPGELEQLLDAARRDTP